MDLRLRSLDALPESVAKPGYWASDHGVGIVHIGLGAFHKAHQAVYTDDALAHSGGDWRILGVSLRSAVAAESLNPQNGLYTLIQRGANKSSYRVIASIARAIGGQGNSAKILDALANPAIRIVSVTVTEKAYGINRLTGGVDRRHAAVAADLNRPDQQVGVLGILVAALAARRDAGVDPFTVLCCDNLPSNGEFLRAGVVDFARAIDPDLAGWIAGNVSFPATMVDRITPAATATTLADAKKALGQADLAAVETEPFSQWVIEDNFPHGRPAWEAGGALFVEDVSPYENMKLRMLNGAHSLLAYAGFLSGQKHVSDAMGLPALAALVERHMRAAADTLDRLDTLDPLADLDLAGYRTSLLQRFCNPSIKHQTYQIAMDGTEKLPQRIFEPALVALTRGQCASAFAFATAAWMRYCIGRTDDGLVYDLRDPRQEEISACLQGLHAPSDIAARLFGLAGLFPKELTDNAQWTSAVTSTLASMHQNGMMITMQREAQDVGKF